MKRFSFTIAAAAFMLFIFSLSSLSAQGKANTDWDAYSKELMKSLKSPVEGVRLSAMQRIIQYSDSLSVINARYDVMDLFLNEKDQKVRQLALAALSKINNSLDIGRLQLHFKWEKDPVIKMHISFVLLEKGVISYQEYWDKYQVADVSK
jgi:hypothetical protein